MMYALTDGRVTQKQAINPGTRIFPPSFPFPSVARNFELLLESGPRQSSPGGGDGGARGGGRPGRRVPTADENGYIQSLLDDINILLQQRRNIARSTGPDARVRAQEVEDSLQRRIGQSVQDARYLVDRALFNIWAPTYDDFMARTGHTQAMSHLLAYFQSNGHLGVSRPGTSILDASCGTAIPLEIVLRMNGMETWHNLAIQANDISPDMAALGHQRLIDVLGPDLEQRIFTWSNNNVVDRRGTPVFGRDLFDILLLFQTFHLFSAAGRLRAFENLIDAARNGATLLVVEEFPPKFSNGNGSHGEEEDAVSELVRYLFKGLVEPGARNLIDDAPGFRTFVRQNFPPLVFRGEKAVDIDAYHTMHGFAFGVDKSRG